MDFEHMSEVDTAYHILTEKNLIRYLDQES